MEQLGYQAESATWRNAYLQGALEMRHGAPKLRAPNFASADMVRAMPLELYFDFLAMRLDGRRAEGRRLVLNWQFSDTGQRYVQNLENCALTHVADAQADDADATLTLTRATLDEIVLQQHSLAAAVQDGLIQVRGPLPPVLELMDLFDHFERMFNIVEPRPPLPA
jgi:alkyl sulfatase BDS1-like metallo-beta-lactamase superfamily hydrolase